MISLANASHKIYAAREPCDMRNRITSRGMTRLVNSTPTASICAARPCAPGYEGPKPW